ncbi:BRO-N domain-containing protein [Desulfogranum marinum]|uniref:BRO-N domain-containing protein n=1 Tax=Desulfogranum marinum TaxID=453220 RepID=UPI001962F8FF|nr:Bro-N domain-containing protein [Desulfogranum marinum]
MKEITLFDFEQQKIRTITIDNDPWFVAKDIAVALGYTNPSKAVRDHCQKPQPVGLNDSSTLDSQTIIINEPDLYQLISRSKLPTAQKFEAWIFKEVLPAIREAGGAYMTAEKAEELILNPDLVIGLAQRIKQLQTDNTAKQKQIEASTKSIRVREYVKVISSQSGVAIGEHVKPELKRPTMEEVLLKEMQKLQGINEAILQELRNLTSILTTPVRRISVDEKAQRTINQIKHRFQP